MVVIKNLLGMAFAGLGCYAISELAGWLPPVPSNFRHFMGITVMVLALILIIIAQIGDRRWK